MMKHDDDFIPVLALSSLVPGRSQLAKAGSTDVALVLAGEDVHAFQAKCSHAFMPLDGARVKGDTLMCPHHGARFYLADGRQMGPPAVRGICKHDVRVVDGMIEVKINEGATA